MAVFTSDFGGGAEAAPASDARGPTSPRSTRPRRRSSEVVDAVPGAVDVGLSTQGTEARARGRSRIAALAGTLGVTVGQVAQSLRPAFAGIDAGDWVDPTGETRDVEVRLAPEARRGARICGSCRWSSPGPNGGADARCRSARSRRSRQGVGPAHDQPPRSRPRGHRRVRTRQGRVIRRGDRRTCKRGSRSCTLPPGVTHHAGRRRREPGRRCSAASSSRSASR